MSPSTSGDAALSVPMSPSQSEPVPGTELEQHAHAHAQAHSQGHGALSRVAGPLAPAEQVNHRVAGNGAEDGDGDEAKAAGVLSTPATPVPSTENHLAQDQNDKWAGAPASAYVSASASASVPKRPTGPSLLTQQLAEARGILPPVTGQSLEATHLSSNPSCTSTSRLQQSPYDLPVGSHPKQELTSEERDPRPSSKITPRPELHDESDGGSLTPRASPRAVAMVASAAVSTLSLSPRVPDTILSRTLDTSETGDAERRFRSHRELSRSSGRGISLERTDKERRLKEPSSTTRTYSDTSLPPTAAVTTVLYTEPIQSGEQRSPTRPRQPDHRLSLGPEKAWSIGSEDLNNAQDGLVEKSIAEVLAGVEPNARSRKASHSLRFFKEGLPEEKSQRRETRLGPKEKLSLTDDVVPVRGGDQIRSLQTSPGLSGEFPGRLTRTRTFPLQSNDTQHDGDEPMDYFLIRPGPNHLADETSSPEREFQTSTSPGIASPTVRKLGEEEGRGRSSDAAMEDGELSGEEKISSAVFVPHKGPQQQDGPDHSDEPELDFADPVKPGPRNGDGSSWLVKADEPEADDPGTPKSKAEDTSTDAGRQQPETRHLDITEDQHTHAMPVQSVSAEHEYESQYEPTLSNSVSPGHGDHVHDHQLAPEQPLDAIELVPYRHQVGGHTTLWRFSKRAVCKQLNNRENEFYEQIEKHHRDLLPFLPRYIGVLNVTFSKQPRRKSTARRDTERKNAEQKVTGTSEANGSSVSDAVMARDGNRPRAGSHPRMISQSMQSGPESIPTVTFLDNQHILPRSLLQPAARVYDLDRVRSSSVSVPASHYSPRESLSPEVPARPTLEDRHANSWGTTVVNKKLRQEVFNDAFLKQPINVQRHKKAYQRTLPRKTLDRLLRPASSDPTLVRGDDASGQVSPSSDPGAGQAAPSRTHQKTLSDVGPSGVAPEASDGEPNEVTGTSAPEPDILSESMAPQRRKRRHSGSALRRRPKDVSDPRGSLHYWEEPDEAGYKGDNEDLGTPTSNLDAPKSSPAHGLDDAAGAKSAVLSVAKSTYPPTVPSLAASPTSEFKRVPRPVNPKEAQTQRDSRVSYFLLLEDLTAGMKKPCIMDLKMGTRQYGVEATEKKQKSQQRKCAQTTSRELGVRVCGLQVWDAKTKQYVFRDKYYGRSIKAGDEFQDALTRFLYDGADRSSILRHIPTVLQKLSKLEVIARRLRGYRFYAASLLVTYDGDQSDQGHHDTAIEDSTTDIATDIEDVNYVRKRKNKREIDFKIADFANSLTPQDLAKDKPCPPQHPDEPDRGFLKGLRSLRRYFLKIQQDTRAELGLAAAQRNLLYDPQMDLSEDDESVSE